MNDHRLAEARSLALHAAVAERLRADPSLVALVEARVEDLLERGLLHPRYAREWIDLLRGPIEDLCAMLIDPGEEATALRQSTPFAGVLDSATRWRIWREVTDAARRGLTTS